MSVCGICHGYHLPGYHEGAPHEYEDPKVVRDGAWGLLTNRKALKDHEPALAWAGGYVDLTRPTLKLTGFPCCPTGPLPVITLPEAVVARVRAEARDVVDHAIEHKRHKYGGERMGTRRLQFHLDAFGAEEAVAQYLGVERTQRGIVVRGFAADVDGGIEVRQTAYRGGRLILHPEDKDLPFVLAIGELPTYRLVGWLPAKRGRIRRYWDESADFPAFFVPQDHLHRLPFHPLP